LKVTKAVIDDSSFGAAMLAGVGTEVFSGFEEAVDQCVKLKEIIEPNMANHEKYERLFALYKEIHDGLAPVYRGIADEIEK
jgi:xylulokinase